MSDEMKAILKDTCESIARDCARPESSVETLCDRMVAIARLVREQHQPEPAPNNPHNLRDGELLEVSGGPHDGTRWPVSVLFPFLEGGCPSAVRVIGGDDAYRLDAANRRWVWIGKAERKNERR